MIGVLAGFFLTVLAGVLLVGWLLRNDPRAQTPPFRVLTAAAGLGIGPGLFSIVSFFSLLLTGSIAVPAVDVLLVLLPALLWVLYRKRHVSPPGDAPETPRGDAGIVSVASLAVLLLSLAWWLVFTLGRPHGDWDAWAIWNLRAHFLSAGGGWRAAFDPAMLWSHPDYPLLLPLAVARLWSYAGTASLLAPAIIAWGTTFGTAAILFGTLWVLEGRSPAAVATAVLFGAPMFVKGGSAQQADLPVAFFCLCAAAALTLANGRAGRGAGGWVYLAGLAAGCAGWTKNEGVVLCIVFGGLTLVGGFGGTIRPVRRTLLFVAGALPAVAATVLFKMSLAPPSELFSGTAGLAERLFDPGRYALIVAAYGREILNLGMGIPVVAGALLLGRTADPARRRAAAMIFAALALLVASHIAVYLITPHDLAWHLGTSLNRLLIQLWPTFVLAIFLQVRFPDVRQA